MIAPDESGIFQASFVTEVPSSSNYSPDKNCIKDFQRKTVSLEGCRKEKKPNQTFKQSQKASKNARNFELRSSYVKPFFSAYLEYPDLEVAQNNRHEHSVLSFGRANEPL